ncbi:hypothetical protein [Streptomyces sp. JH34]|uniref:hypothetical protein n=1 Tax=Streptomyces sp. JH34 TaxID=2793633 RepID=UPI0023F7FBDC|nr:hypothetical protein [Streptomyces sp. JH34]MDF6016960.1 hypothetical protein [Streptomyces sp. JH34]
MTLVAVVLLAMATGCGGGDDSAAHETPKSSASETYSPEAEKCFADVLKAVHLTLKTDEEGYEPMAEEDAEHSEFLQEAAGTRLWDIYESYTDMGAKDLADGSYASATDAASSYAPSVKLECVQAYG